jgi:hypothetical protein
MKNPGFVEGNGLYKGLVGGPRLFRIDPWRLLMTRQAQGRLKDGKVPQNFIDRAEGAAVCCCDGLHGFVSLRATEIPDSARDKSRALPGQLWMGAAHQTFISIWFLIFKA